MARVLVTRPQPLADETTARLRSLGHDAITSPLLEAVAIEWAPPTGAVDAVVFTSPQAPRLAGTAVAAFRELPTLAVGTRTVQAARESGFVDVCETGGDASAVFAAARQSGFRRILHLAGYDRAEAIYPPDIEVIAVTVYKARLAAGFTPEAEQALQAGSIDWALLFSARTARHFAILFDRLGMRRDRVAIVAISPAVQDAAGPGWRDMVAATVPGEAHILAAAGLSCDKPSATNGQEG